MVMSYKRGSKKSGSTDVTGAWAMARLAEGLQLQEQFRLGEASDGLRRGVALRERRDSARDVAIDRVRLERRAEVARAAAEVQRGFFFLARRDVAQAPDDARRRRLAQVRDARRVLGGGARAVAQLELAVEDGRLARTRPRQLQPAAAAHGSHGSKQRRRP